MTIDPADNPSEPTDFLAESTAAAVPLSVSSRGASTGGLDGVFGAMPALSIPIQDLSADPRLHGAQRMDYHDASVPSLGGIPLVAKISQGGMGAVYYGIHPRLYKEVAVKVLHSHLAEQNAEMVERFCKEARLAAQIQSQHLVSVLDVNRENGIYYFVMEFVRGPTAQWYLERSKQNSRAVSESVALEICIAACTGLAAAHAEGIIHRDVKPGNILIPRQKDADGLRFKDSKLADLGLARNADLAQGLTGTGVLMGTPGYMAPEQALDMKLCGTPADVFGLGASLYALLAGAPPFRGLVWIEPAAPIQKARPEISAATTELLVRCLEKTPEPRYASATELLDALRTCREGAEKTDGAGLSAALLGIASPRIHETPLPRTSQVTALDSGFRAETQRYETRQALFIAIPEAKEAKGRQDWKQVVELLHSLCSDPNNADHPSKKIADALLGQAVAELKKSAPVEQKLVEASKMDAVQVAELTRLHKIGPLKHTELDLGGRARLELVLIPPGTFMMGSPDSEVGRNKDELRHKVTLERPYYIGKFCVTQEQYDAVMNENPSQFRGGTLPVEGVSWDDAVHFCEKVSALTGRRAFVPSEAQWEYACRAGTTTPFHFGTTIATDLSNYDGHYAYGFGVVGADRKRTTIAGTFKPNAFGLYDMHGNVWEWCVDFYNENYFRNSPEADPAGPVMGKARVLRGGSWLDPPADCRSANRGRLVPNYRGANVGFRIAMEGE